MSNSHKNVQGCSKRHPTSLATATSIDSAPEDLLARHTHWPFQQYDPPGQRVPQRPQLLLENLMS